MFPINLRPGVTPDRFEQFLKEDRVEVFSSTPGVRSYVLKGILGAGPGRYLLVVGCDRVENRELYWSPSGETELDKRVSANRSNVHDPLLAA